MENSRTENSAVSEKLKKEAEQYAEARLSELSDKRRKHVMSLVKVGVMLAVTSIMLILTALQSVRM